MSFKAQRIAKIVKEGLDSDMSVVIALQSTGEAGIQRSGLTVSKQIPSACSQILVEFITQHLDRAVAVSTNLLVKRVQSLKLPPNCLDYLFDTLDDDTRWLPGGLVRHQVQSSVEEEMKLV